MLKVRNSFIATDENGNEVLVAKGDLISEISDAGPESHSVLVADASPYWTDFEERLDGWNVSFRVTPTHKLWTEIVTYDAVKLLKALEG